MPRSPSTARPSYCRPRTRPHLTNPPRYTRATILATEQTLAEPVADRLNEDAAQITQEATELAIARTRGVLPAADQDENEDLVGASETAQILGYGNTDSFISALGHGILPDLEQPDGFQYRRGSAGRPRRQRWKRSRLEELAARRSSTP